MSSEVDPSHDSYHGNEDFLNIPEVWPKLASGLVTSICNGPGQYVPVPRLRSKNEAFLPLQVFPDSKSLMTGSVLKLDEVQERVMARETHSTNVRRRMQNRLGSLLNIDRIRSQQQKPATCRVHLTEIIKGKEDGIGFSMEQRVRRWRSPTPAHLDDDNPGTKMHQDGRFQLELLGIYTRYIDPHKLLDCRLPPASPILQMKVKKFYFIYESCVAQEVKCTVRCSTKSKMQDTDGKKQMKVVVVKECPIAFRCVQATVDYDGVIVDIRFDIGEKEVVCLDNRTRYTVLSPQILIHQ